MPSIIFVHGTGVRERDYTKSFAIIERSLPDWRVIRCLWGEDQGVRLHHDGASIPDYGSPPVSPLPQEIKEETLWELLYRDPFCELRQVALLPREQEELPPNQQPAWQRLRQRIESYKLSKALTPLIGQAELNEVWASAFARIIASSDFDGAVRQYSANRAELITTIARAIVAEAIVSAVDRGLPLPDGDARDAIVRQLAIDLGQTTYRGVGQQLLTLYLRPLTWFAERKRAVLSDAAYPGAGDILLYQRRGEGLRRFIETAVRQAYEESNGERVVLLAHSLGGIACFDLLAEKDCSSQVRALITLGSQAPLLYEMDCLYSLRCDQPLPPHFPRWLNVYDRQDLLSYIGSKIFRPVQVIDRKMSDRKIRGEFKLCCYFPVRHFPVRHFPVRHFPVRHFPVRHFPV